MFAVFSALKFIENVIREGTKALGTTARNALVTKGTKEKRQCHRLNWKLIASANICEIQSSYAHYCHHCLFINCCI